MQFDDVLERFPGAKKNTSGYHACCPAHDDRKASLSIKEENGKLLLHCFAGCRTEDILCAIGLTMADLFTERSDKGNGLHPALHPALHVQVPLDWWADYCHVPFDFLATLPIDQQAGCVAFDFGPGSPKKLRQAASKTFVWQPAGAAVPPLWPIPGATLPGTIWLTEGESDATVARHCGLEAFALTKGANTPLTLEQAASLKARGVERANIIFDADEPGRAGATKLAEVLGKAGLEVGIVDLAEAGLVDPLAGAKDLRDAWLSIRDRQTFRERLEFAATTAIPYTGAVVAANSSPLSCFVSADILANSDGQSSVDWLPVLGVDGLVGRGLFTLLSARPKAGKTTLVAHCVNQWLAAGLNVAWLTEEPKALWRDRIAKLGLAHPNLMLGFQDGAEPQVWCGRLKTLAPDIIILDTVRTFLDIFDENDSALVHRKLYPFVLLGRELNAALLALHHRRKADGDEGTDHAGSHAFVGDCDIAISLREEADRRRQLSVRSRFEDSPDKLLLELSTDGEYKALGRPDDVALEDVRRRARDVMTGDYQATADILEGLSEPKPSREHLRRALHDMHRAGEVERLEGRGNKPDQWRFAATTACVYPAAVVAANSPEPDAPCCAFAACTGAVFAFTEAGIPVCERHHAEVRSE
ncbi:MAG: AAA family ATPase [Chloroflexi bacterium]|nr:AAA family ATPase [Chloroflexota bacterium]